MVSNLLIAVFTLVAGLCVSYVQSSWMYMGIASLGASSSSNSIRSHSHRTGTVEPTTRSQCGDLTGLVPEQIDMCQQNPSGLQYVALGAKLGMMECQHQFHQERWNCTPAAVGLDINQTVFDQIVQRGTRETAFIHAITSAGVVHAVTTACSAGNLTECTCDIQAAGPVSSGAVYSDGFNENTWRWGGCSDNVGYGVWFTSTFVDAAERDKIDTSVSSSDMDLSQLKAMINLHNNEVGRKVLTMLMLTKCRCHGVSGSCAVRTCWKSLPPFRHVGDTLKDKYESSVEISSTSSSRRVTSLPLSATTSSSAAAAEHQSQQRQAVAAAAAALLRRRRTGPEKRMRREPVAETELVYIERSPNYCRADVSRGILGTKGRECQKGPTATGPDSCHSLCCGRGHSTSEVRIVERCQCKFVWCCEVKCKTCERVFSRHTCK